LHEVAQVAIVSGPNRQMEVVGHQTLGEQTDRRPLAGFVKELEEGQVITILVKHGTASVATIQNVVAITTLRSSTGASHVGIIEKDKMASSEKAECPLFCLPFLLAPL